MHLQGKSESKSGQLQLKSYPVKTNGLIMLYEGNFKLSLRPILQPLRWNYPLPCEGCSISIACHGKWRRVAFHFRLIDSEKKSL